jgi:ABC-type branched-subunit amino acid transport system substrate-binding protein
MLIFRCCDSRVSDGCEGQPPADSVDDVRGFAPAPFAYDCAWVAINAMKQANSAKPEVFMPTLRTMQYDGISGTIEFDAYGDLKHPTSTLYQVKDAKWVPLTTISAE